MKIDVRTPQSVYITIGNKTFYIDDSTNESIMELLKDERYCNNCGSKLGIDCGDAEPDYNEEFCSKGCYKEDEFENSLPFETKTK